MSDTAEILKVIQRHDDALLKVVDAKAAASDAFDPGAQRVAAAVKWLEATQAQLAGVLAKAISDSHLHRS